MTTIMYVSAILAVVIVLTIIGVLSRYRRCKPNQVLVVYGKTGGEKKSAIVRSKAELEVNKAEAERTVPVISLTMLSRPSLRHWESLISFRLQIL